VRLSERNLAPKLRHPAKSGATFRARAPTPPPDLRHPPKTGANLGPRIPTPRKCAKPRKRAPPKSGPPRGVEVYHPRGLRTLKSLTALKKWSIGGARGPPQIWGGGGNRGVPPDLGPGPETGDHFRRPANLAPRIAPRHTCRTADAQNRLEPLTRNLGDSWVAGLQKCATCVEMQKRLKKAF